MPTFQFGNTEIEYALSHSDKRKVVTIRVDMASGVNVIAPCDIDSEQLQQILRKKAPWILKKLAEFHEIRTTPSHRQFVSGEKLPYLGRQYRLKVQRVEGVTDPSVVFRNGRFVATVPNHVTEEQQHDLLKPLFQQWYINHGRAKLLPRMHRYAAKLGHKPRDLVIKNQQARWGSCTKNGTIHINWRILMAPMRIVDYVLVHELVHLIHPNHSSDFWLTMQSIMPDYDERKEWLRIHGPTLEL